MSWFRNAAWISAIALLAMCISPSCTLASEIALTGQKEDLEPHSSGGPRLVRISRGAFNAHILPESHLGTQAEQDSYYWLKVMPVARQARVLIHEFADLYALPGSPLWGPTCLEGNWELTRLGERLIENLMKHHRFSQWADVRRVLLENDPTTVNQQFEAFLKGRGMMLNFWDLFFNVSGGLQREVDQEQRNSHYSRPRQLESESSPRRRITRDVPTLQTESIESLEDLSSAVCRLQPKDQSLLLQDALQSIESIHEGFQDRSSDYFEVQALLAFDLMRLQQRFRTGRGRTALQSLLTPSLKVNSSSTESVRLGISTNPATDQLLLSFRNMDWATKIERHAAENRRGVMYVFGAAHLIDYDRFDGILTLLRKRGFQIELIR